MEKIQKFNEVTQGYSSQSSDKERCRLDRSFVIL